MNIKFLSKLTQHYNLTNVGNKNLLYTNIPLKHVGLKLCHPWIVNNHTLSSLWCGSCKSTFLSYSFFGNRFQISMFEWQVPHKTISMSLKLVLDVTPPTKKVTSKLIFYFNTSLSDEKNVAHVCKNMPHHPCDVVYFATLQKWLQPSQFNIKNLFISQCN
jgi:hypothetical protein